MKKIAAFFFAFLLSLLFLHIGTEEVLAQASCEWGPLDNVKSPYNEKPSFCVGGFSSPEELRSNSVALFCEGWCGGWIERIRQTLAGGVQTYDLNNATEIGQAEDGSYFTCLTGDLDSSVRAAIQDQLNDWNIACRFTTIESFFLGGGLVVRFALVAANVEINPVCRIGLQQINPVIVGSLVDSGGQEVCRDGMPIWLNEQGQIVTTLPKVTTCERDGVWGIQSAVGCIPIGKDTIQPFVTFFLSWAGGIAGGIAFLLMVYAGFLITTSAGDTWRLQAGKELLTSAVSGLVFLVFSVFLLRIVGVDILVLPGLVP